MSTPTPTLEQLLNSVPQHGRVDWIGLRPEKKATIKSVQSVEATTEAGLTGDRYAGKSGKRQVTLIQMEHMAVLSSIMKQSITPDLLRRNIAVSGINLLSLKDKQFRLGSVLLEYTGLCHPCSYIESVLGEGGYNALRGHGGINARVLENGRIGVADVVVVCSGSYHC